MPRVKRGMMHIKHRRKILSRTKGFMWGRKSNISQAIIARTKAGAHAYKGRKLKKRVNRSLWQVRIGAAAKQLGISYSKLIDRLNKANITLNRKVLSEIAAEYPAVFGKIVDATKQ
ncbi:50S ribosomal protein L20 [Candidatus Uhrbacteria bacterium]|nr:50S ribosomal protein L20 [Candidatus Uhrbacteria bacterium]